MYGTGRRGTEVMKNEVTHGGMEEFSAGQREPCSAEIDTLIERSSLGTPAAKSMRERTPIEAVQPILDRANNLATGPFAHIGIEVLPRELSVVLTDHYGIIHGRRRWPLPNMEVSTCRLVRGQGGQRSCGCPPRLGPAQSVHHRAVPWRPGRYSGPGR